MKENQCDWDPKFKYIMCHPEEKRSDFAFKVKEILQKAMCREGGCWQRIQAQNTASIYIRII